MALSNFPTGIKVQIAKSCDIQTLSNLRSTSKGFHSLLSLEYLKKRQEIAEATLEYTGPIDEESKAVRKAHCYSFWSCNKCVKTLRKAEFPVRNFPAHSLDYLKIFEHYPLAKWNPRWNTRQCLECRLRSVLCRVSGRIKRSTSKKNCIICKKHLDKKDLDLKPWLIDPFSTRAEVKTHWSRKFCRICFDQLRETPEDSPCGNVWMNLVEIEHRLAKEASEGRK
jgi:hypothetical protein